MSLQRVQVYVSAATFNRSAIKTPGPSPVQPLRKSYLFNGLNLFKSYLFNLICSVEGVDSFNNPPILKPVLSGHRIKQTPSIKQTVAKVPKFMSLIFFKWNLY